ncbi:MAG: hypothetical protein ACREVX_04560 [Clostridium sp.]|uniref:hypothetical protein n=1 Tax=Clostridium sp. TaxID=1506 RepID=UPI003D6D0E9E
MLLLYNRCGGRYGGLGYLVFSGAQTVNNNMILAGAIPACFLAIFLDFVIGKVEGIVVP